MFRVAEPTLAPASHWKVKGKKGSWREWKKGHAEQKALPYAGVLKPIRDFRECFWSSNDSERPLRQTAFACNCIEEQERGFSVFIFFGQWGKGFQVIYRCKYNKFCSFCFISHEQLFECFRFCFFCLLFPVEEVVALQMNLFVKSLSFFLFNSITSNILIQRKSTYHHRKSSV